MRFVIASIVLVASLLGGASEAGAATPRASGPTQIITVTSKGYSTTYATLKAWELRDGQWVQVMTFDARIGSSGFSQMPVGERRQHSGTSPVGDFPIGTGFGLKPNPGTAMPWRLIQPDDYWVYDPKDPGTYNQWIHGRLPSAKWRDTSRFSEHLITYRKTYQYAFVIGFNLQRDTRMGGGIFLHVNGAGATAGCVSISKSGMKKIAQWLRPSGDPHIVMGPAKKVRQLIGIA